MPSMSEARRIMRPSGAERVDQHGSDVHGIGERRDVVTQRRTAILGEQLLWPHGITSILRYHRRRAALTFRPMPDRADYPRLPKTVSVTLPARTRNRPIALGTPTRGRSPRPAGSWLD